MTPLLLWYLLAAIATGARGDGARDDQPAPSVGAAPLPAVIVSLPAPVLRRMGGTPEACWWRIRLWAGAVGAYLGVFVWFAILG